MSPMYTFSVYSITMCQPDTPKGLINFYNLNNGNECVCVYVYIYRNYEHSCSV